MTTKNGNKDLEEWLYSHLSLNVRLVIEKGPNDRKSHRAIVKFISRNVSTVYLDIKKQGRSNLYHPSKQYTIGIIPD